MRQLYDAGKAAKDRNRTEAARQMSFHEIPDTGDDPFPKGGESV